MVQHLHQSEHEKPWVLVNSASAIVQPLAIISTLFGLFALVGYATQVEWMYRPVNNGPATNPLTAITFVLLGLGLYKYKDISAPRLWLQRLCAFWAIVLTTTRIFDIFCKRISVQGSRHFKRRYKWIFKLAKITAWGLTQH